MRRAQMPHDKMKKKILVKDVNDVLICTLCNGYLIDATALTECHHTFCRGCILKYFENCKAACPLCNVVYKKKNQVFFKADLQLQSIVYKLVPALYSKEMQRREDFYRSTGVRASSSCSDDSVLERERDMINDEEISSYVGDKTQFFGPEDSISLSLEYYQIHLDTTPIDSDKPKQSQPVSNQDEIVDKSASVLNNNNSDAVSDKHKVNGSISDKDSDEQSCKTDRRYLQCPAAVSMKHLQKFVRMKFALAPHHKVDIIYEGEVLPEHFSLMDVAYTFKWKRLKPMRFFYRIFTPLKIQPIKIINTTSSNGNRQLQVVTPSIKSTETPKPLPPPPPPAPPSPKPEIKDEEKAKEEQEKTEEKERLLAHLQLQSKTKVQNLDNTVPEKRAQTPQVQDCVFDYEEQDKEEIKRFAEIRDREWALQKKLDESREKEKDEDYHHFSKKRKKNKHSKNDCTYKKRKLHAEITNKEEELKLKVKLTQHNGHKHKHHKSDKPSSVEMSSKEKLLQMRQVRHKHVSSEDKNVQTLPSGSVSKETSTETTNNEERIEEKQKFKDKAIETSEATNGIKSKEEIKKTVSETNTKTLRSDFPTKTTLNKEWGNRVPTVQIERNEQTEQQAKKTFLKSYQAYAEKYQKALEKAQQNNKTDSAKNSIKPIVPVTRPSSSLERKIANLQQRCTIEPKLPENKPAEKKPEKPKTPPQYPPGFTVSKIETGTKRKMEDDNAQEKRPSLEITLINPPTTEAKPPTPKPSTPNPTKRPPPDTIPLVRIKKSFNFKSGISIIPKTPPPTTKCDNIGALDLSAKSPTSKEEEASSSRLLNGFTSPPPPTTKEGKNVNMSNLQMLSKVAAEHLTLNKTPKPRPQIPNLQTLRIPSPNQRIPPSLKMIDRSQFRMVNPQIRNLRPNQNQSIRNIPNPSLIVKQQQNRLNSMNPTLNNNGEKEGSKVPETPKTPEVKSSEAEKVSV